MFVISYNVTKPEIPWNFRFLITPVLWLLSKTCELETQIESLCKASIAIRCLKSFKQSKWHSMTKSFFEHRIRFQNRFVQSTKFFLLVIDESLHNHSYSTFLLLAWTNDRATGRVIGDMRRRDAHLTSLYCLIRCCSWSHPYIHGFSLAWLAWRTSPRITARGFMDSD